MFSTAIIKNAKRSPARKIRPLDKEACALQRPDERTMPYFEVVPEQVLSDERYLSLPRELQGEFWRLIVHVFAQHQGLVVNHPGVIAELLGMNETTWQAIQKTLVSAGLLQVVRGGNYLLQHEFREQYLQTLAANNAKRRQQ